MPRSVRHHVAKKKRVDERIRRLTVMTEAFTAAFGAELAEAQVEMSPDEFAHFVETLGIGRTKVDRFMQSARMRSHPVDELRPSAWALLFNRLEPIPLLPGERDAVIADAVVMPEPSKYRRRVDLLSANGLVYMLAAMHHPEALSGHAVMELFKWISGDSDPEEPLSIVRSWRSNASDDGHGCEDAGMDGGIAMPKEAHE